MNPRFTLPALIGSLALVGSAHAQYLEVFTEADAAQGMPSAFLDATVVDGSGNAYALFRDTTATVAGQTTKFDGLSFTVISDSTDWQAAASSDMGSFIGAAVVGTNIRFSNFFDNNVYDIDINTGAVSTFAPAANWEAATLGAVNITASYNVQGDGSIYAYDGNSDSILYMNPAGVVSVEVGNIGLATLTGSSILAGTGMEVVGDDLYFGSNSGDSLYKWNTVTDTGSVVFNTAQLEALTDDIDGSAGIDDIFYAPDGLIYFYEDDSDYLMSFDPADPTGTLAVVLTEAQLLAGPAPSDGVSQLAWYDGNIAWTDQSDGFYVVPEPTSLALLGLGGLLIARRRR